jgi:uncharacterized membrane protein YccC
LGTWSSHITHPDKKIETDEDFRCQDLRVVIPGVQQSWTDGYCIAPYPINAYLPNVMPLKFDAVRFSVQIALVSCLSYLAGIHFTALFHGASASIGGLWSAISGIVVLQGTRRETWSSGSLRIVGTAVGSAISAACLSVMSFSPIGMAASMFVTVLVCYGIRIPDHARLAAITVSVIMVTASLNPTMNPIENAALRFFESCIGTVLAVLAVFVWPGPRTQQDS